MSRISEIVGLGVTTIAATVVFAHGAQPLIGAQVNPSTKTAKAPMRTNVVIREIVPMLKSRFIRAKGMITITTSNGADCRKPSYSGKFEALSDPTPELPVAVMHGPSIFLSFLPGVQHKFIGHVCWPGADSTLTGVNENSETGGDYRGDTVILVAPISIVEGSFVLKAQSPVFEIKSDPSNPLVLLLTPQGYKRVSGKGTVRTPNGRVYDFRQ